MALKQDLLNLDKEDQRVSEILYSVLSTKVGTPEWWSKISRVLGDAIYNIGTPHKFDTRSVDLRQDRMYRK